jgi:TPR repeat protein
MTNLGRMYLTGRAPLPEATKTAIWKHLSATHKIPEAAYILAEECSKGDGVPRNNLETAVWYRLAANQGHVAAAYRLGAMYDAGKIIPSDPAEAARWYLIAAKRGHAEAQYSIGLKYGIGRGVAKNLVQAYAWLDIAARQGEQKAVGMRDIIAKEMTRPQFYEAQRLKREWLQIKGIIAK